MYVFLIYVLDFVCASDISSGIYWKYAFFIVIYLFQRFFEKINVLFNIYKSIYLICFNVFKNATKKIHSKWISNQEFIFHFMKQFPFPC